MIMRIRFPTFFFSLSHFCSCLVFRHLGDMGVTYRTARIRRNIFTTKEIASVFLGDTSQLGSLFFCFVLFCYVFLCFVLFVWSFICFFFWKLTKVLIFHFFFPQVGARNLDHPEFYPLPMGDPPPKGKKKTTCSSGVLSSLG